MGIAREIRCARAYKWRSRARKRDRGAFVLGHLTQGGALPESHFALGYYLSPFSGLAVWCYNFRDVMPELFTIGHSTQSWEQFLDRLARHHIKAVGDVRSSPYSVRLPQFNREILERTLKLSGIQYVFLGNELGARRSERECYVDGIARYDRIARTPAFQSGLDRVRKGVGRFRLALMCAEKDPLECHRTILVCREVRNEFDIRHILDDGTIENHSDAEARLLAEERVPAEDFFISREELIARAYDRRGGKIAYRESDEPAEMIE